MKIATISIDLPDGKIKYHDNILLSLVNKDKPKKIVPYFVEFIQTDYFNADVIVTLKKNIIDILILDMEKLENKINRTSDNTELELLNRCLDYIQQDKPLCNFNYKIKEKLFLESLSLISIKPTIQLNGDEKVNDIIKLAIEKSDKMFFYTSGSKESHAWLISKGSNIISCAAKIHTDLARGFIKGDVVSFDEYMKYYNFKECKSKGVARVVEQDYIVKPKEIIEIRFNI